jgi:serine/threonine protein kinase
MGCVMGEMILGRPLFPGESGVDQLVEIIKVLGTPTKEQLLVMVPSITEFNFPQVKSSSLSRVFKGCKAADDLALDFLTDVLRYEPNMRIALLDTYSHPYFDELRAPELLLPNGKPVPDYLFNFTKEEVALLGPARLAKTLPKTYRAPVTNST